MATHLIENRSGARMRVRVPGRGLDVKTFDRRVAKGDYVVIERDVDPDAEPTEPTEPTPDDTERIAAVLAGNVGEVIAHAQANPDDVAALLAAEQASAEPRKGVVDQLTALAG